MEFNSLGVEIINKRVKERQERGIRLKLTIAFIRGEISKRAGNGQRRSLHSFLTLF